MKKNIYTISRNFCDQFPLLVPIIWILITFLRIEKQLIKFLPTIKKQNNGWHRRIPICWDNVVMLQVNVIHLFVFDDCMYYGDDDVTVDATKGGALSYNKFREGAYDENTFQDTWNRCYNGIRQASIFIQYADMSIEHSAEEIIDLKAQARFVRAYYYWLLLRKYGPIPLVPDEGFDYNQSYEDFGTSPQYIR